MRQSFVRVLFGAALAASGALAAHAGSISVNDGAGRTTYLGSLQSMVDGLTNASQTYLSRMTSRTTGIELSYDPGTDRLMMYGTAGYTQADADWARANIRIYDIYRQLGGNEIGLKQQYRINGAQFYVGLDGTGGQWFPSLADAQGHMFKLLVGQSADIPKAVKAALLDANSSDLATIVARARDAMLDGRGVLATGTTTTVTLTGANFSATGGLPTIMTPDGVTATNVVLNGTTQITATLAISESAPTGLNKLFVFNAGKSFMPADGFDVLIVSGSGTISPPADDHGDTVATATAVALGSTTAGVLGRTTDSDLFQVTLAAPGTLTLTSTGPTDVNVRLEDATGALIASDDDSGGWYNFRLVRTLAAGTYYVRVVHCCAGTGAYGLVTSFAP